MPHLFLISVCEVQSDKATVEITSRFEGTVQELCYGVSSLSKCVYSLIFYAKMLFEFGVAIFLRLVSNYTVHVYHFNLLFFSDFAFSF